jgi:hypothetical protein
MGGLRIEDPSTKVDEAYETGGIDPQIAPSTRCPSDSISKQEIRPSPANRPDSPGRLFGRLVASQQDLPPTTVESSSRTQNIVKYAISVCACYGYGQE